jgi:hypothetical protein
MGSSFTMFSTDPKALLMVVVPLVSFFIFFITHFDEKNVFFLNSPFSFQINVLLLVGCTLTSRKVVEYRPPSCYLPDVF